MLFAVFGRDRAVRREVPNGVVVGFDVVVGREFADVAASRENVRPRVARGGAGESHGVHVVGEVRKERGLGPQDEVGFEGASLPREGVEDGALAGDEVVSVHEDGGRVGLDQRGVPNVVGFGRGGKQFSGFFPEQGRAAHHGGQHQKQGKEGAQTRRGAVPGEGLQKRRAKPGGRVFERDGQHAQDKGREAAVGEHHDAGDGVHAAVLGELEDGEVLRGHDAEVVPREAREGVRAEVFRSDPQHGLGEAREGREKEAARFRGIPAPLPQARGGEREESPVEPEVRGEHRLAEDDEDERSAVADELPQPQKARAPIHEPAEPREAERASGFAEPREQQERREREPRVAGTVERRQG
jgi:hypothetical protein